MAQGCEHREFLHKVGIPMEEDRAFLFRQSVRPAGPATGDARGARACRNATALHVERSLAQTMAASWRASAGAIVLLGGAGMVAEGSHAGAASSIVPTDAARVEVALQRERIRELRRAGRGAVRGDGGERARRFSSWPRRPRWAPARTPSRARAGTRAARQSASLRSARAHDCLTCRLRCGPCTTSRAASRSTRLACLSRSRSSPRC